MPGGRIDGEVFVGGYPKQQDTFSRVAGYVEQFDIHSPNVTVHESLVFSARLRLPAEVDKATALNYVKEVRRDRWYSLGPTGALVLI